MSAEFPVSRNRTVRPVRVRVPMKASDCRTAGCATTNFRSGTESPPRFVAPHWLTRTSRVFSVGPIPLGLASRAGRTPRPQPTPGSAGWRTRVTDLGGVQRPLAFSSGGRRWHPGPGGFGRQVGAALRMQLAREKERFAWNPEVVPGYVSHQRLGKRKASPDSVGRP
jgi:hypothetical protein